MSTALIGGLILTLREAEVRRLGIVTDKVVEKNLEASPGAVMGFIHRGLSYRHSKAQPGKLFYGPLHESLHDEMDYHVLARKNLDSNLQEIKQALLPVARLSVDDQDLRDGLPDCLTQLLPASASILPRTRPPGWMLEESSRAHTNFKAVLDDIEFYCAARLIV